MATVAALIVSLAAIRTGKGFHHGDSLVDGMSSRTKYCRMFHWRSLSVSTSAEFSATLRR